MKKIAQKSLFAVLFLATVVPAFAETGARKDDGMGLVYSFLAICGLIVFFQIFPVLTLAYGMIKGLFGKQDDELESMPVKPRS